MYRLFSIFCLLICAVSAMSASNVVQDTSPVQCRIQQHVSVLASDSLNGRGLGTKGSVKAQRYIIEQLHKLGAEPLFEAYQQPFYPVASKRETDNNSLIINGFKLKLGEDYYPITYSGNGRLRSKAYHIENIDQHLKTPFDYPERIQFENKIWVINVDQIKRSEIETYISRCAQKGAGAVLFYSGYGNHLKRNYKLNVESAKIPVLYTKRQQFGPELITGSLNAVLETELSVNRIQGINIGARITGDSSKRILLCAHYDHLSGSDCKPIEGDSICNGANDNAASVAALIEAYAVLRDYNIAQTAQVDFVFFDGEEKGMYGSNHFVQQFQPDAYDLVINLDMIGTLDWHYPQLNVAGNIPLNSLDEWIRQDAHFTVWKQHNPNLFASDHRPFMQHGFKAIILTTPDYKANYHTPKDEIDTINFKGVDAIFKWLVNSIRTFSGAIVVE